MGASNGSYTVGQRTHSRDSDTSSEDSDASSEVESTGSSSIPGNAICACGIPTNNAPKKPPVRSSSFKSARSPKGSHGLSKFWGHRHEDEGDEENVTRRGRFVMENIGNIEDFYQKGARLSTLTAGHECSTWKATNTSTGIICAIKTLLKRRIKDAGRLKREIAIMKQLDHPHVLKLYETFEDADNVHIITEYCAGGDLFDSIQKQNRLTETQAAAAMKQLLRFVLYLHEQSVCHRDLKPEHILFESQEQIETNHLKVIDFAHAARFSDGKMFKTKTGTPFYVAPETLQGRYTHAVDMWSCGVIMYIMLSGHPPFTGPNDADVLAMVRKGEPHPQPSDWKDVSRDAIELVTQLLRVDASERLTAYEAVNHAWIARTARAAPATPLQPNVVQSLRRWSTRNRLKKAALQVVADRLQEGQIKALRAMFLELDTDGDGLLTGAEISEGLRKAGFPAVPEEIQQIIDGVDSDGSGAIEYTEFLAASLDKQIYTQKDACWAAFRVFDRDGNGKISIEEVQHVLKDPSLGEALQQYDRDGDGTISFEEFERMMHKK